ncbi:MAG: hypothetical protein [Microvirus sp.]|nr:MAG: hypothetical protein [Microvirus sp.]
MKHRKPMNKHSAARSFNHASSKTHPRNMQARPMRGGFRL